MLHILVAWLDRVLIRGVGVVVQQRSQVDPDTAGTQNAVDGFDIEHHVVCSVQKKAGSHTVPLTSWKPHIVCTLSPCYNNISSND